MLIEELNLIPSEENYLKLISSCRSTVPGLRPQVMSNGNPSDAGFAWIKRRFGLHGTPSKPVETTDSKTGLKRIFIPSGIKDNPYLDHDPQYHAFLNSLPDGLREAWRDGSWDEPIIPRLPITMITTSLLMSFGFALKANDPAMQIGSNMNARSCYGLPPMTAYYPGNAYSDFIAIDGFSFANNTMTWDQVFDHRQNIWRGSIT